jgi:hypothetical protein
MHDTTTAVIILVVVLLAAVGVLESNAGDKYNSFWEPAGHNTTHFGSLPDIKTLILLPVRTQHHFTIF